MAGRVPTLTALLYEGGVPAWYDSGMTTVEILYSYTTQPTEKAVFALANAKDVYGIRKLSSTALPRRSAWNTMRPADGGRGDKARSRRGPGDCGELPLIPDVAAEPVAAN